MNELNQKYFIAGGKNNSIVQCISCYSSLLFSSFLSFLFLFLFILFWWWNTRRMTVRVKVEVEMICGISSPYCLLRFSRWLWATDLCYFCWPQLINKKTKNKWNLPIFTPLSVHSLFPTFLIKAVLSLYVFFLFFGKQYQ